MILTINKAPFRVSCHDEEQAAPFLGPEAKHSSPMKNGISTETGHWSPEVLIELVFPPLAGSKDMEWGFGGSEPHLHAGEICFWKGDCGEGRQSGPEDLDWFIGESYKFSSIMLIKL